VSLSVLLVGPAVAHDGLEDQLVQLGVSVSRVADVGSALEAIGTRAPALCLVDLAGDGVALSAIRLIRARHPEVPLAAIADFRRPVAAAEAIHAGVADVLPWPIDEQALVAVLANARDRVPMAGDAAEADHGHTVVAYSAAMRSALEHLDAGATRRGGVCLQGESGSGRELLARTLHMRSALAANAPFVVVDCAVGPVGELDRRLFGRVDLDRNHSSGPGLEAIARESALAAATGGTIVLRNPADVPARVQARLVRVLRDGEGLLEGRTAADVRVRPMAVTDTSLEAAVADGRLRRDLYLRLSETIVEVPPLRQRREDIPALAAHFVRATAQSLDGAPPTISRSALALLTALPWHGNARELRALVERLCRSASGPVIQLEDVLQHATLDGISARGDLGMTLRDAKAAFERECISAVLKRHHGRVGEAAKALGIQRTNLYRKVRQLKMERALIAGRR